MTVVTLAVGCSDSSPAGNCGDAGPGDVERVNVVGDVEQEYWLMTPEDYTGDDPTPLWLLLPGGLGDHQAAYDGWSTAVARADALVAIPSLRGAARDPAVISGLIADVADDYCVDTAHVHAIGTSGSSTFTAELMKTSTDEVASFAIGIGGFNLTKEDTPPAAFWSWTGDQDQWTMEASAVGWAAHNGCDSEPVVSTLGEGIEHWHFEGCAAPSEYYYFEGMGHQVPSHECLTDTIYCAEYDTFDFVDEVTVFFDATPLSSRG